MSIAPVMSERRLRGLSITRMRSYRSCARKYQFTYVDGFEPAVKAEALDFGEAIHKSTAAWWAVIRDRGEDPLTPALKELQMLADPFLLAKAEAMIAGYHHRWLDWARTVEVLGIEVPFRMPLMDPDTGRVSRQLELEGVIDLLIRENGENKIVERKSTSESTEPGGTYRSKLRLDGQVAQYFAGGRALGLDPQVCIFDVLAKPDLRPLKRNKSRPYDETPAEYRNRCVEDIAKNVNEYYAQIDLVQLEDDDYEWQRDVWDQSQLILHAENSGCFPKNPEACFQYNRACEFWPVCTKQASLEDATRYRIRERRP